MNKSDVTDTYSMGELLPVVSVLTEEYTAKESSSVTYEKARQLMEAVIYCIAHAETRNVLVTANGVIPAKDAYRIGYDAVVEKVGKTLEKYNAMMEFFHCYGNRNYGDTVEKALPGFFLYYDPKFAPMEHIITMDYPIFTIDNKLEGIDIIAQYIDCIWEEQMYLRQYPREYVVDMLRAFHPRYEQEFFNVKEILELYGKR
ncbi:MAG: DUF6179 domain-containing protein [Lachnospiraceae bacterium]|nr:DUF6179 domain-containing protein [Lachnospiraceae bacterium]